MNNELIVRSQDLPKMSIKKGTAKDPQKEEDAENRGGVKCRIYKAKNTPKSKQDKE